MSASAPMPTCTASVSARSITPGLKIISKIFGVIYSLRVCTCSGILAIEHSLARLKAQKNGNTFLLRAPFLFLTCIRSEYTSCTAVVQYTISQLCRRGP